MAAKKQATEAAAEPSGFTPHSGGLSSEYAREQGWGLNQEERTRTETEKQPEDGGTDYEYGAQDFGDTAVDTSAAVPRKGAEAVKPKSAAKPKAKTAKKASR